MNPPHLRFTAGAICAALAVGSCANDRSQPAPPVTYASEVAAIFEARCTPCHAGESPSGGWRATSYFDALSCLTGGRSAALPPSADAPIARALKEAPHEGLLSPAEKTTIERWIEDHAPLRRFTAHPPGIANPTSAEWHGRTLRDLRWAPMLDGSRADACGRCHEGTPARPTGVLVAAPGASPCTSCHSEATGVLACGTCHGKDGAPSRASRDCADGTKVDAHQPHVRASESHSGFSCRTCHPIPSDSDVVSGLHGNGSVEVVFDRAVVTPERSYERSTGVCSVSCHDRGGARAHLAWSETEPVHCGDCHGAPPVGHFGGACTGCHGEANADGTHLTSATLHINGRVDLGTGQPGCGACHGHGLDAWPDSGAHAAHHTPSLAAPVPCDNCHVVPLGVTDPGHMDGVAGVRFSGRAIARGAAPVWRAGTCDAVACHGANLNDTPAIVPNWSDGTHAASACGACHGLPPTQHTASTTCERSVCHGSEVVRSFADFAISPSGRELHTNGAIDTAAP